ncbi:hypothetical protein M0802_004056 [Mischocyttarus mexicanus]|nr:hypothetical protein M0802_004056 [Mischocyttarus mexicanus]
MVAVTETGKKTFWGMPRKKEEYKSEKRIRSKVEEESNWVVGAAVAVSVSLMFMVEVAVVLVVVVVMVR